MKRLSNFAMLYFSLLSIAFADKAENLRILNFQADNGFQHPSKTAAMSLVERLGKANGWEVGC